MRLKKEVLDIYLLSAPLIVGEKIVMGLLEQLAVQDISGVGEEGSSPQKF